MLSHGHRELAAYKYVVFTDATRRYVDCSDGVRELLGYTRAEMLEKNIEDVSFDIDNVPQMFAQYLQRGAMEGDFVLRHKEGNPVPITYQAFVFADGCIAAAWEPIRDWREPYLTALIELNTAKLKDRVATALGAIQRRMKDIDCGNEEKQDLRDAISTLQSLK